MGHLEIACFNAESARRAAAAGAHCIELCSDRESGGVTPPLALLKDLRSEIPSHVPINVMIRPRGGDFTYSEAEFHEMSSSIETMKAHCDGFVFGILKENKTVDIEACTKLVKLAEPHPCTFHRAFDLTPDLFKALDDVESCGFKTVLTSGGPGTAMDNRIELDELVDAAQDKSITIMPGGGVRADHIPYLWNENVPPTWYHSSAIIDGGEIADEGELRALAAAVAECRKAMEEKMAQEAEHQ